MDNQIDQIQASYNAPEDRILLKIKTLNEQVYLAWITRRYLMLLLPALQGQHPTTGASFFDAKTQLIHEGKNEEAQISGNYGSDYAPPENPVFPLGETPVLLAKITFKDMNTPQAQLILEPEMGAGIQLPFNPSLLGSLLKIFDLAMQKADWALKRDILLEMPVETRLQ